MGTQSSTEHYRETNNQWRAWINAIGIIIAVIGLFWHPIWMGIIGAVLGISGASGAKSNLDKTWGWITVVVGLCVLILGYYGWTFAS